MCFVAICWSRTTSIFFQVWLMSLTLIFNSQSSVRPYFPFSHKKSNSNTLETFPRPRFRIILYSQLVPRIPERHRHRCDLPGMLSSAILSSNWKERIPYCFSSTHWIEVLTGWFCFIFPLINTRWDLMFFFKEHRLFAIIMLLVLGISPKGFVSMVVR